MPANHTGRPATGPPHAELTIRIEHLQPQLAGQLAIAGQPASTFTGWLDLLTALDEALDTLQPPSAEGGAGRARPA